MQARRLSEKQRIENANSVSRDAGLGRKDVQNRQRVLIESFAGDRNADLHLSDFWLTSENGGEKVDCDRRVVRATER